MCFEDRESRVEKEECGRHARGTEPASSVFETIFERILIFQSVRMNVPLSYLYYREFSACAGACAWHVSLTSHMIRSGACSVRTDADIHMIFT